MTPNSINSIFGGGVKIWFEYLDYRHESGLREVRGIEDVDRVLLTHFIVWLQHRPSRTQSGRLSLSSARACYRGVRAILIECVAAGDLDMDCFPMHLFPDVARTTVPHRAYSKEEMRSLLTVLASDLKSIRSGTFAGSDTDWMFVYFMLVAARTGRNPTSLYEMDRDALTPHPLKPDTHSLLTTYKRRGNTVAVQCIHKAHVIEHINVLPADVTTLILEVRTHTEVYLEKAPSTLRNRLWLYQRRGYGEKNAGIGLLSQHVLSEATGRFIKRHDLRSNDFDPATGQPKPFRLTIMRLRKTFASRMWEITGGDLVTTAHAMGNSPHVTDTHYLAVTPMMLRNHHFLGKCLEIELRGASQDLKTVQRLASEMKVSVEDVRRILSGSNNTGVGRCSSPLNGRFAPKDGQTACTAFLHCFRCPNQVVMESDLHRLFSFYWLLIKERSLLRSNQWQKVYGGVIREIDQVIAPRFATHAVESARERARVDPHPMWRDRSMLLGGQNA